MHRPRITVPAVIASPLVLVALAAAGCSGGPEEPILQQFFTASRLRDNASLATFALISLDPKEDGTVQSFSITQVGAEQRTPLQIKALAAAADQARQADEAFTTKKLQYSRDHMDAVQRILKAEGAREALKGKDAEIQAAWNKWREEQADYSHRVSQARRALMLDKVFAEVSMADPRNPVDVTKFEGDMVSKDVILDARVRAPDGQIASKVLVVTLRRAVLKGDKPMEGRWVVAALKDVASGKVKSS